MNNPEATGMTLIRYLDIFPWTKDPDSVTLKTRAQVTDPMPMDCQRLRVEIKVPKSWFAPDTTDETKAKVTESEVHDGVERPGEVDNPTPLAPQGS